MNTPAGLSQGSFCDCILTYSNLGGLSGATVVLALVSRPLHPKALERTKAFPPTFPARADSVTKAVEGDEEGGRRERKAEPIPHVVQHVGAVSCQRSTKSPPRMAGMGAAIRRCDPPGISPRGTSGAHRSPATCSETAKSARRICSGASHFRQSFALSRRKPAAL